MPIDIDQPATKLFLTALFTSLPPPSLFASWEDRQKWFDSVTSIAGAHFGWYFPAVDRRQKLLDIDDNPLRVAFDLTYIGSNPTPLAPNQETLLIDNIVLSTILSTGDFENSHSYDLIQHIRRFRARLKGHKHSHEHPEEARVVLYGTKYWLDMIYIQYENGIIRSRKHTMQSIYTLAKQRVIDYARYTDALCVYGIDMVVYRAIPRVNTNSYQMFRGFDQSCYSFTETRLTQTEANNLNKMLAE